LSLFWTRRAKRIAQTVPRALKDRFSRKGLLQKLCMPIPDLCIMF
jgi:hypothetical protein